MKSKKLYLALALSLAVAVALINIGYALTSSVEVGDSSITATEYSVDITVDGNPLAMPIEVIPPTYDTVHGGTLQDRTVTISGHELSISSDGFKNVYVRAFIMLNSSSWIILDDVSLTITINDVPQTYSFVQDVAQENREVSVPTASIALTIPQNDTEASFDISLSFVFKDVMYDDEVRLMSEDAARAIYDACAASISGTITFAMTDSDPLSNS